MGHIVSRRDCSNFIRKQTLFWDKFFFPKMSTYFGTISFQKIDTYFVMAGVSVMIPKYNQLDLLYFPSLNVHNICLMVHLALFENPIKYNLLYIMSIYTDFMSTWK